MSVQPGSDGVPATESADVVVIGGNLLGSMAAIMLARRGVKTVVLEGRPEGREQKVVVGEAITEGSSVFLRHEIGLTDWLMKNCFRKFGFDFLTLPRGGQPVQSFEDCHELMLSTLPLERIPSAFRNLIPTFHVERTSMNRHLAEMSQAEGADYRYGAHVEHVALNEHAQAGGQPHEVRYTRDGEARRIRCRWVVDCSGRRTLLSRQLGLYRQVTSELDTASVWNRFSGVSADPAIWRGFHGIDRRKHTVHMTGPGFWIWWIHQREDLTSVGISWDNERYQPDIKTEDRGFWEMMSKFPPVLELLRDAQAREPYQYYAHLPYQSERWIGEEGYTIVGDAAWFTDALYSIGIETGCRQLVMGIPMIVAAARGGMPDRAEIAELNQEFQICQRSVLELNRFKYKHAWGSAPTLFQTAVYELGEIAELYYLRNKADWRPEELQKHYRLQWHCPVRRQKLLDFLAASEAAIDLEPQPGAGLMKKALLPSRAAYAATWPLWQTRRGLPRFFQLVRSWAYSERLAQSRRLWPDVLGWMATSPHAVPAFGPPMSAHQKAQTRRREAAGPVPGHADQSGMAP